MIVNFLFSAPKKDISVGPEDLVRPFKITPLEDHPFLTLGDYFHSLKKFLLKDKARALCHVVKAAGQDFDIAGIDRMTIKSEKHGALYHLASVEVFAKNQPFKLAVSTAISQRGTTWLDHEYEMLGLIHKISEFPYLPEPYFRGNVKHQAGMDEETFSMFVTQWFEGYHEWHFSLDEMKQKPKICIWDQEHGHRFASQQETFEIFKQASKILTLYFNTENFNEIFSWHHAAGDFVVKNRNGMVDVKLTTARSYRPCIVFEAQKDMNPMIAIVYFFLNMALKMRLDRLDGLGEVVWAEHECVKAAATGFFEALCIMEEKGRYHLGKVPDLLVLLKAFSLDELGKLYYSVLDFYGYEDQFDLPVIQAHQKKHVNQLYEVLQDLRL